MTIGIASAVVGVAVLLAWIPLRNRPGIGTIANVIVIAITVDAGLAVLPTPTSLPVRVAMMVGAVVLNAISTVLYVGAGLGPGPRDGLMTGLVVRTGLSVRLVRTGIEATVLAVGWLLGGTVGVGTVVYAFGIGPLVQFFVRITPGGCWPSAAGRPSRRPAMRAWKRGAGRTQWAPKSHRYDGRVPVAEGRCSRPRPADRLRQGLAAARRPRPGRARHVVGRTRRTLGGHRPQRRRQDVAAAHRRRDGASVVGHGLRARRTAGPGRHVRTALPRRAEQLGAVAAACPTARWCATSSSRPDTP